MEKHQTMSIVELNSMNEEKKEPVDFLKNYVGPHRKKSREVTDKDMDTVQKDAHIMYNLCYTKNGVYNGGYAVAHPQINDKDPLRFFVTKDKEIIINPIIVRHTKVMVPSEEGCLSYPERLMIEVGRWNKCVVKYNKVEAKPDNSGIMMGDEVEENLSGRRSKIFQHEIDHFDAKYIYDEIDGYKQTDGNKKNN